MKTCKYDPETRLVVVVTGLWQVQNLRTIRPLFSMKAFGSPEESAGAIIQGSRNVRESPE